MARNKQMMSYENRQATQTGRTTVVPSSSPPTYEAIQGRAYEIFLARGSNPGTASDDWFQAERDLIKVDPASVDE